ncbi:hypothetical protein BRC86_08050 [Halobacteriales archaeon QS_3_64_16]|nr:MAG: hypothetical protein BRC86_08050 [Halobacteriales archaeon QS_3_64_16]
MDDTAKYLVHADIVADGVVERSDVVGAIFGQTEGLLGEELDLRSLQRASKVGRINVEIDSENGQSFGQVSIATSLDRIETAILAAALETIDRVGPCRANVAIARVEDVRAAKRREVVERAKDLLGEFDESVLSTRELIDEVRESVRVEDITEYEGLPAGPSVPESDAVIVVEGRADVLTLLRYGIKNAIAVEGTNVPEAVADLTTGRMTTAFLDGDRGGDLILKELGQVGEIDHVAIAPAERSVEDLTRREALAALRGKVPYSEVADASSPREALAVTDGDPGSTSEAGAGTAGESSPDAPVDPGAISPAEITGVDSGAGETNASRTEAAMGTPSAARSEPADELRTAIDDHDPVSEADRIEGSTGATDAIEAGTAVGSAAADADPGQSAATERTTGSTEGTVPDEPDRAEMAETSGVGTTEATAETEKTGATPEQTERAERAEQPVESGELDETDEADAAEEAEAVEEPESLHGHVRALVDTDRIRVLDADLATIADSPVEEAFDAIANAENDPMAVVLDGELTQRILDIAAQRGVEQVIARKEGSFVKQPTSVRVRTASQLQSE